MKQYEFVNVPYTMRIGFADLLEHRQIIQKYAKLGYRFVGSIPTDLAKEGFPLHVDLIFEKDEDGAL